MDADFWSGHSFAFVSAFVKDKALFCLIAC